jgi:hypothetical protein
MFLQARRLRSQEKQLFCQNEVNFENKCEVLESFSGKNEALLREGCGAKARKISDGGRNRAGNLEESGMIIGDK